MAADPLVAPPRPRAPQRPRLRPAPPPRRVGGPAAPARTGRPGRAPQGRRAPVRGVAVPAPTPLHRALGLARGLPDSKLLDRLLRGQGWVVLIGIALMGIVALQVSLLKMNSGIGQSIERSAVLERQNADMRAEISRLSSEERIAKVAGKLGLVMPNAGQVRYVDVRGERDARRAAEVMRAPDPVDATAATTSTTTPTTPGTTGATTATTTPASGTAAPAAPATTTAPPAQTAPVEPATPTQSTPSSSTAGATAAPAGTSATPGQ
jgi:cell division protein FtsL